MAQNEAVDVTITNGVNGDASEFDHSVAKEARANAVAGYDHLKAQIDELEREKRDLIREIAETKAVEAERWEMENKAMESMTKRAFELEGEVVHLQHDLVMAMNGGDEAGRESERPRAEVEELRREKHALWEKISAQAEELKRSSSDSWRKISELDRKIEELQFQANTRLDEMEKELTQQKREKTEVEDAMRALEMDLKKSEEKILQMAQKWKESDDVIAGMVEKARINDGGFRELKKKMQSPVAGAVSAGVVVAAVCFIRYSRTR